MTRLLSEAEIQAAIEMNYRDGAPRFWPAEFGIRLISDVRRLREAVRLIPHAYEGFHEIAICNFRHGNFPIKTCTPDNCVKTTLR